MLDLARDIIGTQPILAAFLAIGVGYLVGQINLGGFSLGVGAVLFVGLAIGAFAPKAQIVGPIGLTGLIMFLYGIGILYGRQFFEGMVGRGRAQIQSAGFDRVSWPASRSRSALGQMFGIKVGQTLGIFAGSMTSTATLQAALDVMGNKDPSIGYSVAYPFGVIGPILCIYFMTRTGKAEIPAQSPALPHGRDHARRKRAPGRTLDELDQGSAAGVQVTMVRKGGQNLVPSSDIARASGDGLMIIADRARGDRGSGRQAGPSGARPDRQGSVGAGLHPRLRRQGQHGRRFRSRNCRCLLASQHLFTSGATTWTSCRRPI